MPLTEIGKIESMEIARIVITPKKDLTPKRNDGGNDRRYRPAVIPANVHYYLDMKFLDAYEADKPRAIRVRLKNESFTPQKHDIRALQDYIEKAQEIICTP